MNGYSAMFEGRQIIDLAHPLGPQSPPFPGDPPLRLHPAATVDPDDYALTEWSGVFHCGTHMDAPSHFVADGVDIQRLPVDFWAGKAWVMDVPYGQDPDLCHFTADPPPADISFLLIRTGWEIHYPEDLYFDGHPVFTPALTAWLAQGTLRGVGMDMPSPDRAPWNVHKALLSRGMVLLENLCGLHRLPLQRSFDLLCIPLPLQAEASWVRPLALL